MTDASVPPVPPLPDDAQRTPAVHPVDVFTSPPRNSSKPLPPIRGAPIDRASHESDTSSLVVVDPISRTKGQSPSPEKRSIDRTGTDRFICHGKRRSMSVSDIDLQKINLQSSPPPTLPPKDYGTHTNTHRQAWESTSSLNGILSDFKGVLSKLDPDPSSSLDLHDPCTPARRTPHSLPSSSDTRALNIPQTDVKSPVLPSVPSTPTVSLPTDSSCEVLSKGRADMETVVPPRSSSLLSPSRSRSGSNVGATVGSPRFTPLRYGSSPLTKSYANHIQSSYRDMPRLRAHHRSTASSSEPSLLPTGEDGLSRETRSTLSLGFG